MFAMKASDWNQLRDIVWEWDPIGLTQEAREGNDDEYDCIIEAALPLVSRQAPSDLIIAHLNAFLASHFGLQPQPESASNFVEKVVDWYRLRASRRP